MPITTTTAEEAAVEAVAAKNENGSGNIKETVRKISRSPPSPGLKARTKRSLTITSPSASIINYNDSHAHSNIEQSGGSGGDSGGREGQIKWQWVIVAVLLRSVLALMQLDTSLYNRIELNVPTTSFKRRAYIHMCVCVIRFS